MPDSREEKRAITAFLNTQQDRIYNLWALQGLTIDEIHRELVWNLKLGWVSYGRLQAAIKGWRETSRPGPWPERQRSLIARTQEGHVLGAHISLPAFASPQQYVRSDLCRTSPENLMHTSTMGIDMSMASSNNLHEPQPNFWQYAKQDPSNVSLASSSKTGLERSFVQEPSTCSECGKIEGQGPDWQVCHCA